MLSLIEWIVVIGIALPGFLFIFYRKEKWQGMTKDQETALTLHFDTYHGILLRHTDIEFIEKTLMPRIDPTKALLRFLWMKFKKLMAKELI